MGKEGVESSPRGGGRAGGPRLGRHLDHRLDLLRGVQVARLRGAHASPFAHPPHERVRKGRMAGWGAFSNA
eukprot:7280780-Pyramimonas_sp.AAC.1